VVFEHGRIRFGITPTCWTNDDFPLVGDRIPFEQVVSEMALAGFEGCSVGHNYPTDVGELRAALELRGLQVSEPWASAYFTVAAMADRSVEEFRHQTRFIKDLGGTDIGLAELGHAVHQQPIALKANKPVFDDGQWTAMIEGLHTLGKIAVGEGMRLCYHPHMGTGVQDRAEIDRLMTDTDPELVHLLLDTGHTYWSGADPLAVVQDHVARIAHVHLKDIRREVVVECDARGSSFHEAVMAGVFAVPGDGDIDFVPILQTLSDAGFEGWLVVEAEQDPARHHPLTQAKKAREYLRAVTGR
jgi:inosose dehydratase